MTTKDKILQPIRIEHVISDAKLELAKEILLLQRHIVYTDYAIPFLKLRYDKEITDEVRAFGYTIPGFNDENYLKALETIESFDADRISQLEKLINEYNLLK